MGMTAAGLYIHNEQGGDQKEVIKQLENYMLKQGYVLSNEENSDVQYRFHFSETTHNQWFMLEDPDFMTDMDKLGRKAEEIAGAFAVNSLSIYLCDSDFAILQLYGKNGQPVEQKCLGMTYWEEEEEQAMDAIIELEGWNQDWQSLLVDDYSLADLTKVFNQKDTFVEDTVRSFGELIGLDDSLLYDEDGVDLHFKRREESGRPAVKKPTIAAVFKQQFGELLLPMGFVKAKGMNQIFMRMVGDDILEFITYQPKQEFGSKGLYVLAGLASVYRPRLDFKNWKPLMLNGCEGLASLYRNRFPDTYEDQVFWNLYNMKYVDNCTKEEKERLKNLDEKVYEAFSAVLPGVMKPKTFTMDEAVEYLADWTTKLVFPIYEEVQDCLSARNCMRKYGFYGIGMAENEEAWLAHNENPNSYWHEDMLDFISGYRGDFQEYILPRDEFEQHVASWNARGRHYTHHKSYESYYEAELLLSQQLRSKLERLRSDPDLTAKAIAECERRKEMNLDLLRELGVEPRG